MTENSENTPTTEQVRVMYLGDLADLDRWFEAEKAKWQAEGAADALEAVADHFEVPRMLWMGDSGVTVYDTEDQYNRGVKPTKIRDWLRQRAAAIREGGQQ